MPNPQYTGLYFTSEHIKTAHENVNREPFQSAWMYLSTQQLNNEIANDNELMLHAFRYRLNSNEESGAQVVHALQSGYGLNLATYATYFDALVSAVTLAHAANLVYDHPAFATGFAAWQSEYTHMVTALDQLPENASVVDIIWQAFLNLVATCSVMDDEDRFRAACEVYRQTIEQIRPEGYLPAAVEIEGETSLHNQFYVVAALVCMAEVASHAGVELWNYTYRGISVITAAAYITYYYYYPDQWHWGTIGEETTKALFQQAGSFLEMVNHHAHPSDLKLLLDEQRPLFNAALGGLTTLTHALPTKERRGLFG